MSSLARFRRDLHRIPELDFDLPETTAYVRGVLEALPCRVFSPCRGAVCAWFDWGRPASAAFRADMDALPIQERTGAPYASCHPGRMHACGHDGHMAMVLALAEFAAQCREGLPRNLLLVFQPAEETTGGADLVCRSGVFEEYRVERIFGMHLWPGLPAGALASRPGPLMARASEVTVRIQGRSSHIARAEEGADALLAAARLVCRADRLTAGLSREEPCLLKFGRLESGSVRNALSASSLLLGSLRVFSDGMFQRARAGVEDLAGQIAAETGCSIDAEFSPGYPPVCNDPELYRTAAAVLPGLRELDSPLLIAEDFSFYQRRLPGLFLLLGTGTDIPLHGDAFDFDERVLETGLDAWKRLAAAP